MIITILIYMACLILSIGKILDRRIIKKQDKYIQRLEKYTKDCEDLIIKQEKLIEELEKED